MKQLLIALSLFLSMSAVAQQAERYEYLTMTKFRSSIHISIGSEKYEEVNIKKELKSSDQDFTPVHRRIEAFEAEGWEFVSSDFEYTGGGAIIPTMAVTMRRKK